MAHKPVPPTPYYLSMRSAWFMRYAEEALARGNKEEYQRLMLRAIEYRDKAGQLPMEGSNV